MPNYSTSKQPANDDEPSFGVKVVKGFKYSIFTIIFGVAAFFTAMGSWFTVDQGYEGIVTRFGAARYTEGPGLHFKLPWIDSVTHMDMRELTNTERMETGTNRTLPIKIVYSQTWRVKPGTTLDFYKNYGDRVRFEAVILDPRVKEVAKAVIAKYDVEQVLRQRQEISSQIDAALAKDLSRYPVEIVSSQLEDVQPPQQLLESILAKEQEREQRERETFALERQKLVAQREVQTAMAQAEATIARAQAEATAKRQVGDAEAAVIEAKAKAIASSSNYITYEMISRWGGQFPTTYMGGNGGNLGMLFQMPTAVPVDKK